MRFATPLTLTGPARRPAQMLGEQTYDGHVSVHDDAAAAALGLAGAPIEGPTHFSQIDPFGVSLFGDAWFERGCISAHFQTMVVEGEEVAVRALSDGSDLATVVATKADGTQVLTGTISIGPEHPTTELDRRLAALGDPGELHVVDRVVVGLRKDDVAPVMITHESPNGDLYPFSLDEKLASITEAHPWYSAAGAASSPWGRAVVPFEMLSVLTQKQGPAWPVRQPSLGLFLDLEVRVIAGPIFVGHGYNVRREVIARSQSRRVESFWTRSTVTDPSSGSTVCEVVLHQGVFKESYPGYPGHDAV